MNRIYVCSDLHGRYDKYEHILAKIDPSDTLYFLGDAIDRNPDGMKILSDCMDRENVEFFIGNHELMMFCTLFSSFENNDAPVKAGSFGTASADPREELRYDERAFRVWTNMANRGDITLRDFLENYADRYDDLRFFLLNSYVRKTIEVNGKLYRLSHTSYPSAQTEDAKLKDILPVALDNNMFWESPYSLVADDEDRRTKDMDDRTVLYPYEVAEGDWKGQFLLESATEGVTYIGGHIFVQRLHAAKMCCMVLRGTVEGKEKNILFADIDGGCAMPEKQCIAAGIEPPKAILYCITDDRCIYI